MHKSNQVVKARSWKDVISLAWQPLRARCLLAAQELGRPLITIYWRRPRASVQAEISWNWQALATCRSPTNVRSCCLFGGHVIDGETT